jgi:hypothetical protein
MKDHVAPSRLRLVEVFLAAADLASEIAFVGQGQIGGDRRRNDVAATLQKVIATRMEAPQVAGIGSESLELLGRMPRPPQIVNRAFGDPGRLQQLERHFPDHRLRPNTW